MALEVLKDVKEIGGFEVGDSTDWQTSGDYSWANKKIIVNRDANTIAFVLQKGPIKEVGVNGCQIETMISASLLLIERHNCLYPCYENVTTMDALKDALAAQAMRTSKREARGVEGESKV